MILQTTTYGLRLGMCVSVCARICGYKSIRSCCFFAFSPKFHYLQLSSFKTIIISHHSAEDGILCAYKDVIPHTNTHSSVHTFKNETFCTVNVKCGATILYRRERYSNRQHDFKDMYSYLMLRMLRALHTHVSRDTTQT